jgi:hypothetical protein
LIKVASIFYVITFDSVDRIFSAWTPKWLPPPRIATRDPHAHLDSHGYSPRSTPQLFLPLRPPLSFIIVVLQLLCVDSKSEFLILLMILSAFIQENCQRSNESK